MRTARAVSVKRRRLPPYRADLRRQPWRLTSPLCPDGVTRLNDPPNSEEAQMPGMEEVAGYDQFFGPLEWQAIVTGDWSLLDEDDEQEWTW